MPTITRREEVVLGTMDLHDRSEQLRVVTHATENGKTVVDLKVFRHHVFRYQIVLDMDRVKRLADMLGVVLVTGG